MTVVTDRPTQAESPDPDDRHTSQVRRLRLLAVVLSVFGLALGAALVATVSNSDDDGGASSAPDDVIQLVEDFERAFEEQDDELIQSLLTEDFAATANLYHPNASEPAISAGIVARSLTYEIGTEGQPWAIERSGDLLVAGDGPWIIAVRETWTNQFSQDEGTRVFVIVEERGTPKIAGYQFVAVMYDVIPDWGD